MGRSRLRGCGEEGFHLVEVAVAAGIIAVVILGLTGAMTIGMNAVGQSRQRSAASAVASERIERIRNLPYEEVALDVQPSHSTDPDDPDHYVTEEQPPRYDVHQDGSLLEPIVVGGSVKHIEDPIALGVSELFAHQYVTWVDDPGIAGTQNYKRITVVVTWRHALNPGQVSQITTSTFVGRGTVTLPAETPTPATPAPQGEPEPQQSGAEHCDEIPAGEMSIISGAGAEAGYTNSTTVQVRVTATSDCEALDVELSNDDETFTMVGTIAKNEEGELEPLTVAWTIPGGDGSKTISVRLVDGDGVASPTYDESVVLDQTTPTVPADFAEVSCSIQGNTRTVTLTWGASTDDNLSGYRLYRSINAGTWSVVTTTSNTSASDSAAKTHDSVRYHVRAYDKAGNESGASDVFTYHRNSC